METKYSLAVRLSVLRLLGPNLYGNLPAVLSEMIANAWDADAKKVDINVDTVKREIEIEDDGLGIPPTDINDKYLSVGYEKRKNEINRVTASGRHVMGRKGIGKLAIFSYAKSAEIHSSHALGKSGFILDWEQIEKKFQQSFFRPSPIAPQNIKTNNPSGTRILLKNVQIEKLDFNNDENLLRMQLARRFTVLDGKHDFIVSINGKCINDDDRIYFKSMEFVWYLGDSFEHENLCPPLKHPPLSLPNSFKLDEGSQVFVRGWVGTVDTPRAITSDKNNIISIYAHGKLVQEDILASYNDIKARAFSTYLIGDIEADFLDDDNQADIVIANRREVSSDDPRFKALQNHIKEKILLHIGALWSSMRNLLQIDQRLLTDEILDWYSRLNDGDKVKASSYLKRLSRIKLADEDAQKFALIILNNLKHLKKVRRLVSSSDIAYIYELQSLNQPTSASSNGSREGENNPGADSSGESNQKESEDSPNTHQENHTKANDKDQEAKTDKDTTTPDNQAKSDSQQTEPRSDDISETRPASTNKGVSPVFDIPEGEERIIGIAFPITSPPILEREDMFREIKTIIINSKMPIDLKEIAIYDLSQAYFSYHSGAYKASCVMLGAVLEGLMISVVINNNILNKLRGFARLPQVLLDCGISNPSTSLNDVSDRIQKKFTFEDYKAIIVGLIQNSGEVDKNKINEVQVFRNIIHPLKVKNGVDAYNDIDYARAMNLLSSMVILSKIITNLFE